jgi:DAACS family dicarboxylate/amino acid:cation (Na+ or H+) symporter
LTTLFLAQCFGVTLTLSQQALLLCLCILASFGTAGVPAGGLPVIAMLLGYLHVPPEGIGLILGVDRLLDMCRTALNVTGDLATAVVVARTEECDLTATVAAYRVDARSGIVVEAASGTASPLS